MPIKGFVFFRDASSQERKIMDEVSERKYQFQVWSEMTEGLENSFVTLQGVNQTAGGYRATLRISVGGLLKEPMGARKGAYGSITASEGDPLFENLEALYAQTADWPRDEKGSFVLEKGTGVTLPVLSIKRGLLYVGIESEMVKSSAEVADSRYYQILEIETVGEVSFVCLTGGIKRTNYFKISSAVNAKSPNSVRANTLETETETETGIL